ncbi:MAG TPA: HPr-rel-A system PqqD family peptide chaperone [Thiobacillus sp.]|nr:HPr-rel-A system PqqD family peptide chaperone [Thiobacillus sp.]
MNQVAATPTSHGWLFKSWDNEAVLFNTASGDTHYLKPLTLALYQTCRDHPSYNSAEIAAALATRLGVAESPQLHELTEETLDSLHKIGLLESA